MYTWPWLLPKDDGRAVMPSQGYSVLEVAGMCSPPDESGESAAANVTVLL
jgi:hypothetical protein